MGLLLVVQRSFWLSTLIATALVSAGSIKRNGIQILTTTSSGDRIFELGAITFLANSQYPKISFSSSLHPQANPIPSTVVYTNQSRVSGQYLKSVFAKYTAIDDVFTEDFLSAVFIVSLVSNAKLDSSAMSFLTSMNSSYMMLSSSFAQANTNESLPVSFNKAPTVDSLPPGPYAATISSSGVSLSSVYRLYPDSYRDLLCGSFESNDGQGNYKTLGAFLPKFWDPMIPVPSRIYSMYDSRPFAGQRIAIKDSFDIKGLQTSGGSQAWAKITPIANGTAPSIQRIIDLGGVLVGKYKLAQFASSANPWDWQDEHYPFNPRGDGW
jgi:hypothetical protein